MMQSVRRVTGGSELRELATAGAGFLIDPFNRRWHRISCQRVLAMTVGEPKWFAPTRDALDDYLGARLKRFVTAKLIGPCRTCDGNAVDSANTAWADSQQLTRPGSDKGPFPHSHIDHLDDGFQVWADERVRNESTAASSAGMLRRLIAAGLRALPEPAGRVLYATYAGQRARGTDVENLLFNNIDQTLSLFEAAGGGGLRFEDLGLTVPPGPGGADWRNFYSYRLVKPEEPWTKIEPGQLICRVREAVIPAGRERLSARIWLAVSRARFIDGVEVPYESGDYMLKIVVRGLEPARNLKALVDGSSAGLQRDDRDRVTAPIKRLLTLVNVDVDELLALATAPKAPLGSRSRSGPTSREALFTFDGEEQVRVTPDDDRCVAADVVTSEIDGPPSLTLEVFSATDR